MLKHEKQGRRVSTRFRPMTSRSLRIAAIFAMLAVASGQFGTASVQWSNNAKPTVSTNDVPLQNVKTTAGTRQSGLEALSLESLKEIVDGFGQECGPCETRGHWISHIRSACLDLPPKQVKKQLSRRGINCPSCSTREHYLDRLLDTVHFPLKAAK